MRGDEIRLEAWVHQAAIGDVGLLYVDWDTIAVLRTATGIHCINLTTHTAWELRLDEMFAPQWFSRGELVTPAEIAATAHEVSTAGGTA